MNDSNGKIVTSPQHAAPPGGFEKSVDVKTAARWLGVSPSKNDPEMGRDR